MNTLTSKQMEQLDALDLQVIYPTSGMYFGEDSDDRNLPKKLRGKHHGYYFRYKGRHVAACGVVAGQIIFEGLESFDDHGNWVFSERYPVGSMQDVVEGVIAATALLRINGHFTQEA